MIKDLSSLTAVLKELPVRQSGVLNQLSIYYSRAVRIARRAPTFYNREYVLSRSLVLTEQLEVQDKTPELNAIPPVSILTSIYGEIADIYYKMQLLAAAPEVRILTFRNENTSLAIQNDGSVSDTNGRSLPSINIDVSNSLLDTLIGAAIACPAWPVKVGGVISYIILRLIDSAGHTIPSADRKFEKVTELPTDVTTLLMTDDVMSQDTGFDSWFNTPVNNDTALKMLSDVKRILDALDQAITS